MNCKICGSKTNIFLKTKVLNKYDAEFLKCTKCNFIFVNNPHWLNEAYEDAIAQTDTGLVARNINLSNKVEKIIKQNFNYAKSFIDYGGGYGLFVRIMRDRGFNFYRQDIYCQNLFAKYFDIKDLKMEKRKFELLTTFEVFEHLENPIDEIKKMLRFSDSILFSTEIQPNNIENNKDWWYFSPETGQHISFYTKENLKEIAKIFNLNFYTNNTTLHLFTKKRLPNSPFDNKKKSFIFRLRNKISRIVRPKQAQVHLESLTQKDNKYIKNLLILNK